MPVGLHLSPKLYCGDISRDNSSPTSLSIRILMNQEMSPDTELTHLDKKIKPVTIIVDFLVQVTTKVDGKYKLQIFGHHFREIAIGKAELWENFRARSATQN